MSDIEDRKYMAKAIALAKQGLYTTDPNPRVGAVLVKNGVVVGEGAHLRAGQPHAEINALRDAESKQVPVVGATAYVTLEPCAHFGKTPPCAQALIKAKVARVVIGMEDPNPEVSGRGCDQLRAEGITVDGPVLENEAIALNRGFVKRMTTGLPFIRAKFAMSLDGRTAMASGESKWITGTAARRDVQRLRARSSAVMTGIGTVEMDNPSLNLRAEDLGWEPVRQPARIILDSHLKIDLKAKILQRFSSTPSDESIIVVTQVDAKSCEEKLRALNEMEVTILNGFDLHAGSDVNSRIPLKALLSKLGDMGMNEIMVESGSTLAGAFLEQNLIDEIFLYVAPTILGDGAKGLFHLPSLTIMQDKINLKIDEVTAIGTDWRFKLSRESSV